MAQYKLTEEDKKILKSLGKDDSFNLWQVELAINEVDLMVKDEESILTIRTKCDVSRAIEVLGKESFLDGILRAAGHATACRLSENGRYRVYFDLCHWFAH